MFLFPFEFLICYLDPFGVAVEIHPACNLKFGFTCCRRDQVDNYFIANDSLTAPVLTDERKQALLDFIPFTGPGQEMTNRNRQASFVTEILQFYFSQPYPGTIAAPALCSNEQPLRPSIDCFTHRFPPPVDRLNHKGSRILINANTDPSFILGKNIHTIRGNFALAKTFKIIDQPFLGAAFGPLFAAFVLEVTNKLFLLGINRNHRLTLVLKFFRLLINVINLDISVRMRDTFHRLLIRL